MSATVDIIPRQAQQSSKVEKGSHRGSSNSISGIISTLVPIFIVAAIAVIVFLLLRKKYTNVYQPRCHESIVHEEKRRTPRESGTAGFWKTLVDFKGLPDHFVLEHNSLDGYLFLRFFKVLVIICLVGCLITWPILFPVNATGGGGQSQLDILSFSNVSNPTRYYAHALVAWLFLGFVTLLLARERMVFIGFRQAYFLNSVRSTRLTSRTVLFMGIPDEQQSEQGLRTVFGPGNVRKIWMVTDCSDLEDKVEDRTKLFTKFEGGEVKLCKQSNKARLKAEKKNKGHVERKESKHWIEQTKRPTHKLKPIIGKRVDTISYGQETLPKMNHEIAQRQDEQKSGHGKIVSSAFIEFTSQGAAQRAYQLAEKSKKKSMHPRYIDVQPGEVVWKNLNNTYATRKGKLLAATALVFLIILFFTPIVLFIGSLANINYLTNKVSFLSFIDNIPPVILGVVTGLLPTLILFLAVHLVPPICRFLAKFAGEPTLSAIELKTQTWYFIFQVIQVFLITTFTSGAVAVVTQIVQSPSQAPGLLASNLPKASNFYISYFILYGLAQSSLQLLNAAALLLFAILGRFLDSTPRKMFNRWISLKGLGWGSEYPKWTNLGVIALSYSCIAPLVLGFATVGFAILYLAFRYKWLFVFGNQIDMKGEAYSRAMQQLMVGVYLSAFCLIGLFGIGSAKSASSAGPLVLMVIFLVVVIVFQVLIDRALGPLEQGLPLELVSEDVHDYGAAETNTGGAHHRQHTAGESAHGNVQKDVEAQQLPGGTTGNKLTQKIRPYIDEHFYRPNKDMRFFLSQVDYEYDGAYYNPSIVAKEPFVWLARDDCGVSKTLIQENAKVGIHSSDEFAWFDEDNKLHWDTPSAQNIEQMLDEKRSVEGGPANGDSVRGGVAQLPA